MEKCLKAETAAMGSNSAQKPGLRDEAACPDPSRMALWHGLPTWPSLPGPSTLRRPTACDPGMVPSARGHSSGAQCVHAVRHVAQPVVT
jgi:hypothetical protein